MKLHLLLLPCLMFTATAQAVPQLSGKDCDPNGSQMQLNYCAALRLSAADDELNATWKQVLALIADRPLAIGKLKAAQRIWIQLRDADMQAQFPLADGQDARVEYGSIYPMEFDDAKATLTRERTRYLHATWLDDSTH